MMKLLNDIKGVLSEKQKGTLAQAQDRLGNTQNNRQDQSPGPMSEGRPALGARPRGQRPEGGGQRRR